MTSFVIQNALIVDGTGKPGFLGSVSVEDDQIVEVGSITSPGDVIIDAEGLVLAPGIIDSHTHFDAQITWDPMVSPSISHGVTTILIGNCGFTIAPCKPEQRDMLIELMEGVEDIPEVVLTEGLPWNWESFEDYLDALDARSVGLK